MGFRVVAGSNTFMHTSAWFFQWSCFTVYTHEWQNENIWGWKTWETRQAKTTKSCPLLLLCISSFDLIVEEHAKYVCWAVVTYFNFNCLTDRNHQINSRISKKIPNEMTEGRQNERMKSREYAFKLASAFITQYTAWMVPIEMLECFQRWNFQKFPHAKALHPLNIYEQMIEINFLKLSFFFHPFWSVQFFIE